MHFNIIPFLILFLSLISTSLLPQWVLNYHLFYLCICLYVCVRTNASVLGLLSSSLLQAAAEPGQRWRRGSGPALLRLHPSVQLSARLFPFWRFRAPRLPLWQQLDWQGACLQRYVVSRGLRGWNKSWECSRGRLCSCIKVEGSQIKPQSNVMRQCGFFDVFCVTTLSTNCDWFFFSVFWFVSAC